MPSGEPWLSHDAAIPLARDCPPIGSAFRVARGPAIWALQTRFAEAKSRTVVDVTLRAVLFRCRREFAEHVPTTLGTDPSGSQWLRAQQPLGKRHNLFAEQDAE